MNKINHFTDLDAWQKAHELVLSIYRISKEFPKEEVFGITSQLRRAANSVTANIAEGFGRYHFKDKTRFYYQARASALESENFIMLARDLSLINESVSENLLERVARINMLINGLIRSIKTNY